MSTESSPSLETLVAQAVDGDRRALDQVLVAIKDDIYGLAMRMLWHPSDAEDATQEILTKVFTRLSSFRGESRIRTWVYQVAVRHLLNMKRRDKRGLIDSFDAFGADLIDGLAPPPEHMPQPEAALIEREIKIACTQAMLQCLDRDHRMAYILGEIFALPSTEAATVTDVDPATYRKRLSRARTRVREFMSTSCGLVADTAPCRCRRRITPALASGRVRPGRLLFAEHPVVEATAPEVASATDDMEQLHRSAAVLRSNPAYRVPDRVLTHVRDLLEL